jgi:hypothetical protein
MASSFRAVVSFRHPQTGNALQMIRSHRVDPQSLAFETEAFAARPLQNGTAAGHERDADIETDRIYAAVAGSIL